MEPVDFGPAARHLAILVTGVDDAQRYAPTPCPAALTCFASQTPGKVTFTKTGENRYNPTREARRK
jgi:hypothetical protein